MNRQLITYKSPFGVQNNPTSSLMKGMTPKTSYMDMGKNRDYSMSAMSRIFNKA